MIGLVVGGLTTGRWTVPGRFGRVVVGVVGRVIAPPPPIDGTLGFVGRIGRSKPTSTPDPGRVMPGKVVAPPAPGRVSPPVPGRVMLSGLMTPPGLGFVTPGSVPPGLVHGFAEFPGLVTPGKEVTGGWTGRNGGVVVELPGKVGRVIPPDGLTTPGVIPPVGRVFGNVVGRFIGTEGRVAGRCCCCMLGIGRL